MDLNGGHCRATSSLCGQEHKVSGTTGSQRTILIFGGQDVFFDQLNLVLNAEISIIRGSGRGGRHDICFSNKLNTVLAKAKKNVKIMH